MAYEHTNTHTHITERQALDVNFAVVRGEINTYLFFPHLFHERSFLF